MLHLLIAIDQDLIDENSSANNAIKPKVSVLIETANAGYKLVLLYVDDASKVIIITRYTHILFTLWIMPSAFDFIISQWWIGGDLILNTGFINIGLEINIMYNII